jgi:hypothetical protein
MHFQTGHCFVTSLKESQQVCLQATWEAFPKAVLLGRNNALHQFMEGRKEGEIYLSGVLLSVISH